LFVTANPTEPFLDLGSFHQQLVTQYARYQLMKIPQLTGGHRLPAAVFHSHVLPANRASALQPKYAQLNTITGKNKPAKTVAESPNNSDVALETAHTFKRDGEFPRPSDVSQTAHSLCIDAVEGIA
jgi:hypothetical protein